jgi:hypothetical protein
MVSTKQGNVISNELTFWHCTSGPMAWGGGAMPSWYQFDKGQSYLVFARNLDKVDYLFPAPSDAISRTNECRQLYRDGVLRTLDAQPLANFTITNAVWYELNRLLKDTNPSNQLYAIDVLDGMSREGWWSEHGWAPGDFLNRNQVLRALLPLVTSTNENIACRAINCFGTAPDHTNTLETFAAALINVVNESPSSNIRLNAIGALSGTHFEAVSNSLAQLLNRSDDKVRSGAVGLLAPFPRDFSEQALRAHATDESPKVRATVAEVIGDEKIANLLPTLDKLFSDPVGQTNPIPPLTLEELQAGGHIWGGDNGDVHTSAGFALLKFDVEQVGEILKTNISDKGFGLSFIRKLAPNGAEPYFPLLAKELKTHTADSEQEAAKNGFHWPLSYWLSGNFGWAWDTLFGYVSAQPREALANPQFAPMLDALQIADDPGDARTRSLDAFFLDKGLTERAIELRRGIIRRTEDKAIDRKSFNFPALLKAFDEMDKQHSLEPGLGL